MAVNPKQWQQLDSTINAWLKERQELIVLYCSLCGANELAGSPQEDMVLSRLNLFCQILVDYLSAGHFEIFAKIIEEAEHSAHGDVKDIYNTYPKIEASTPLLLDFNDIYDTKEHSKQALKQLPDELSKVGEQLTSRFDYEDRLIRLHYALAG